MDRKGKKGKKERRENENQKEERNSFSHPAQQTSN